MNIKKPQTSNNKDLMYLQNLQNKVNRAKDAITGGGNSGFRR